MTADDIDRVVEIERLAALDPINYEVARVEAAKRLGMRAHRSRSRRRPRSAATRTRNRRGRRRPRPRGEDRGCAAVARAGGR